MRAPTSIQISEDLREELVKRKFHNNETYEEVIWDMIEDSQELNDQTIKELEQARAEIDAGKFRTLAEVKKELGL
jgi:predicted transcriptional regulator